MTKCKSCECECIEELLKNNEDVYFRCVYQDSMPQIGTFLNICDVEQHKEAYKSSIMTKSETYIPASKGWRNWG